jgi:hypothetical protein
MPSPAARRHPRPGETDRHSRLAGDGLGPSQVLSTISSNLEPRCLVGSGRSSSAAPAPSVPLRAHWAADHGAGRDAGAPLSGILLVFVVWSGLCQEVLLCFVAAL